MASRSKYQVPEIARKFSRENIINVNGFEIVTGDLIKVSGEYGVKFKFDSFVTNLETGATWVDCFEMFRGASAQYRSFKLDRVKRIPQRGKRAKRVA